MTADRHDFATPTASATVFARGAELCSLQDGQGREVIWPALPLWPSHAPILFPIIGELAGGTLRTGGRTYPMRRHGFARTSTFTWTRQDADGCTLQLTDDEATRAQYPFPFRLTLDYALHGPALRVTAIVANTGPAELPCSVGFHPAFRWPLHAGAKEAHRIELSDIEADTVAQLDSAGLVARDVPTPLVKGQTLNLSEALFAHDALVWPAVRSYAARYIAPDGPGLTVLWEGATSLGIWSKPGDFVCIEPWRGHADPAGFTGEFRDKPGLMLLPPGSEGHLAMTITLGA